MSTASVTASQLALDHHLLDFRDCLRGVEPLGAGFRAVQDRVAPVQPERILELVEAMAGRLVAAVVGYYSAPDVASRILAVRSWYPGMAQKGSQH